MVVELPERFLEWNYYPRRENAQLFLEGKHEQDMDRFFLDSTRHNPALCTACQRPDGSLFVNAKIVGAGYVLKTERLPPAIEAFRQHLEQGDRLLSEAGSDKATQDEAMRQYQREAMALLMEHLYPPRESAHALVDFAKMSTMELAKSKPWSSKHTWNIVQTNYTTSLSAQSTRPFITFPLKDARNNLSTYSTWKKFCDNSPTPSAYGTRIA